MMSSSEVRFTNMRATDGWIGMLGDSIDLSMIRTGCTCTWKRSQLWRSKMMSCSEVRFTKMTATGGWNGLQVGGSSDLSLLRIGGTGTWRRIQLRNIADRIWAKLRGMTGCNLFRVAGAENRGRLSLRE